jgi:hypothetical protein
MSLDEITTLEGYLTAYGSLLAARTTASLDPLHVPGRDAPSPHLAGLARPPFDAQAHVVTALVKAMRRQRSAWLVAEMGTGKSLMAIAACHAHARGRPYRALVMAPDHLVGKWAEEEIAATVPAAAVARFESWRDVLALCGRAGERPHGAEWYVIGRDQAKLGPAWEPRPMTRRRGRKMKVRDDDGGTRMALVEFETFHCPRCGRELLDKQGVPIDPEKLRRVKMACPMRPTVAGPDGDPIPDPEAPACGEPLWQYVAARTPAERAARKARGFGGAAPYRWAPDAIIGRRLPRGWFDYAILDELHELKSGDSSQGAAGRRISRAARKTIALTGTLIGGYAWHLHATLWGLSPRSVVDCGFAWGRDMPFSERYGRVEEVTITTEKVGAGGQARAFGRGNRGAEKETKRYVRPGVMPTLFADHMIGNAVFLALEEVSEGLPPRPRDEVYGCDMEADQARGYRDLEGRIAAFIAPMLVNGDISLLSRMLFTLLDYPDHPFGWRESRYLEPFGIDDPDDLDPGRVFPKERALIDYCAAEAAAGRRCWVYVQGTGVRDVAERLRGQLAREGLRAGILRSSVDRRERREWIKRQGVGLDVAISHPKLVETGLELFDKAPGGANFPTICFYQTGYNLFTLRQSSRRAWRIGQPLDCRLAYFFYRGTMQERAMALMGHKLAAAEALDGKFSTEGLAAMAGEDSAEMALARSLADRVESAERAWSRAVRPAPAAPAVVPAATAEAVAAAAIDAGLRLGLARPRRGRGPARGAGQRVFLFE